VEGVETQEQYELMKRAQCSVIQGYYFSRPLNQADFTQLLAQENGLENG
jgi:EAL domain-containing protein (putative c-di-GMP-specific phosphodiesterase class I)